MSSPRILAPLAALLDRLMINRVFSPAVAVMDRLKYAQKFVLIGLVLSVPLAFVAHEYLITQNAQISFSSKERVGVVYITPTEDLLTNIVVARSAAVRLAGGDRSVASQLATAKHAIHTWIPQVDAVDAKDGAALQTTPRWNSLRAKILRVTGTSYSDPRTAFNAYTGLTTDTIGLITTAGNYSNLILDPDLDSFYLMDAYVVKLPTLTDMNGQAADLHWLATRSAAASTAGKIQLAVDKGVIQTTLSGLDSDLAIAITNTQDASLQSNLASQLKAVDGSTGALAASLSSYARGSGADSSLGAKSVSDALAIWHPAGSNLDHLLATRISSKFVSNKNSTLEIAIIAVLIGAFVLVGFYQSVMRSLREMRRVADRIAEGDVEGDVHVSSRDEIGQTAAALGAAVNGYLKEMAEAAQQVAAGNLTVSVEPRSQRDLLGRALGDMITSLRALVGEVADATVHMTSASQQMAATSSEASRAVEEIATAVGDVAEGAGRQVHMVDEAKRAADETALAAGEASGVARDGVATAQEAGEAMRAVRDSSNSVSTAMRGLSVKSQQIGGIVDTITGIAGQTNLLALNAAIEAARAGEHGLGFAVVADEVRKLAEGSKQAAADIATLIAEIQTETTKAVSEVDEGVKRTEESAAVVEQAREAFVKIGEAVEGVTARIQHIASVTLDVAEVAEQSSASAEQVSASTEETNASTQEIAESARQLAGIATQLNTLVGRFTV
jgi:methyl-accepting chemotaxis protein